MFICLLASFDTWDCYFESDLSLVLLVKLLIIKSMQFCFLSVLSLEFIFVLILYFILAIVSKKSQNWERGMGMIEKDIEGELAIWVGVYRRGSSVHYEEM